MVSKQELKYFNAPFEHLFTNQPCEIVVDDILVSGRNQDDHDKDLLKVLHRARQLKLKLNPQKCKFNVNKVPFVGHILTSEGVQCDQSKISAIINLAKPKDKTDLRRFFGMCNYVSKCIPNYSEKLANLRELLKDNIAWVLGCTT